MSDEDIEIIPILDDVLVAGDLDKAVTGDIDVKDLESIESFDALFDDEDPEKDDDTPNQEKFEETFIAENSEEESLEVSSDDSLSSSGFDSLHGEQDDISYDSKPDFYEEDTTVETTDDPSLSDSEAGLETSGLTEIIIDEQNDTTDTSGTDPYLESSFIQETNDLALSNQSLIDQAFEDLDTEEDISPHIETTSEPESSTQTVTVQPEPQIDTTQMLETVMREIMPEIETQIRSIVQTSLEKHLTKSDTDSDNDL